MGNFYANITLKAEPAAVVAALQSLRRTAFTSAWPGNLVVVVDQASEQGDLDALASLALTLAARLKAPALAALNHDDDVLLLGLYGPTGQVMEHGWGKFDGMRPPKTDRSAFIQHARKLFGTAPGALPQLPATGGLGRRLLLKAMHAVAPHLLAIDFHQRLAAELGLPEVSAGAGYRYVSRGEFGGGAHPFTRV